MKKTLVVISLAMVAALALCLVACGNATSPENDYIGTWKAEGTSENGLPVTTLITIEEDGIGSIEFITDDTYYPYKGKFPTTWEYANGKVKFEYNLIIAKWTDYLVLSEDKQSLKGEAGGVYIKQ